MARPVGKHRTRAPRPRASVLLGRPLLTSAAALGLVCAAAGAHQLTAAGVTALRPAQAALHIAPETASTPATLPTPAAVPTASKTAVSRSQARPTASRATSAPATSAPATTGVPTVAALSPAAAQRVAQSRLAAYGWGQRQWPCLQKLWTQESSWIFTAENPSSGAYGIPQSLPASKMASAGADWRTNASTQITWGLGYIRDAYGSPCSAWAHEVSANWY